ncbi:hypothetical protein ACHAW6_003447 [Cyclotella cf. meneghiniana]
MNCNSEEWHTFCQDIDQVLWGLVSSATELFHVLHLLIDRVNNERDCCKKTRKLDTRSLSGNDRVISHVFDCDQSKPDLHHTCNLLRLSQMALDLATESPHRTETINEINELAMQEEASPHRMHASVSSLPGSAYEKHVSIPLLQWNTLVEKNLMQSLLPTKACATHGGKVCCIGHLRQVCDGIVSCCWCLSGKEGHQICHLIESLKNRSFGFQSHMVLLWLWRFSSGQKKIGSLNTFMTQSTVIKTIYWKEIFHDISKPVVIDVGCGMGSSLLNLSVNTTQDQIDQDGSL